MILTMGLILQDAEKFLLRISRFHIGREITIDETITVATFVKLGKLRINLDNINRITEEGDAPTAFISFFGGGHETLHGEDAVILLQVIDTEIEKRYRNER